MAVQVLASVGKTWSLSKSEIPLVPVDTDHYQHQWTTASSPTSESPEIHGRHWLRLKQKNPPVTSEEVVTLIGLFGKVTKEL